MIEVICVIAGIAYILIGILFAADAASEGVGTAYPMIRGILWPIEVIMALPAAAIRWREHIKSKSKFG